MSLCSRRVHMYSYTVSGSQDSHVCITTLLQEPPNNEDSALSVMSHYFNHETHPGSIEKRMELDLLQYDGLDIFFHT